MHGIAKHNRYNYSVALLLAAALFLSPSVWAIGDAGGFGPSGAGTAATSAPPSGTASGDLGGTYPSPTVLKYNGGGSWELQLAGGNATFGNNTPYATGTPVVNEIMLNGGTMVHLSCRNITGGTCTTAPTFNVYKMHSAVETDGTPLTCSTTVQGKGTVSSQAQTLTWLPGDEIGIYLSTQGATCTAPIFDVDLLVKEP